MKLKHIIVFCLMIVGLVSCDTALEEEIFSTYSSDTFYQNEDQLQAQNLGIYEAFKHVVWEQDMYMIGTMAGSKYATSRSLGFAIHSAYLTPEQQPFRYDRIWRTGFIAIGRANTIIKNMPLSPFFTEQPEIANRYLAEARWMRAYTYFQLTQVFGDLPIYTEPVTSANPDILFKGRSSVGDVYNLIIEDLIFANENLPVTWTKTGSGRVTKAGGAFLLGKVYLTSAGLPLERTENYQKAIEVLKPLADNPQDYDVALEDNWGRIFDISNEGNKEIIFAFGNIYENGLGGVLPVWANPNLSTVGGIQSANGSNYLLAWHPAILDLYEADDVRLVQGYQNTYINKRTGNEVPYKATPLVSRGTTYQGRSGICSTKYMDGGATNNVAHTKDHIVYRYVDAFLMLAEAYNENGEAAKALPYLKIARDRVNASEITETDPVALRTIIREERTRELYAEMGELFDLRRWGTVEQEFEDHLLRKWRYPNNSWDDKFILSPLPNAEISKNPNLLPNNPGW
ncbi:Starch-binding associating with outer membrane [Algibacter lectus]|uniref:RagB/SusD family nutrient uptake outer membrane protein n=1 Tax=Algibacter lectus TaxID=221126 RepID=UPI0008F2ACCA|nr:RagB/SusD family nutrient uptake outer membrane protein [Algibacter lectus]SFB94041.1 Starch-binding associating with outer membrane [Algibacter lectus]